MAHNNGHSDSPARFNMSKRVVGFVIACGLLCLIWFNTGSEGQLRKTYDILSEKAAKSAASAVSALAGDEQHDVDAQLRNVTDPPMNFSSPAPFPRLPPPDIGEYMALCMAGQ